MISADQLVIEARKLVGVPWMHRGRTMRGVDCIGLIALAARNAGGDVFAACGVKDRRDYDRQASPLMLEMISAHCTRIEQPIPGSLLFFKFDREKLPRHVGIYTHEGNVIHAECRLRRQVIEHGWRVRWVGWTFGVWKLPGVRYE